MSDTPTAAPLPSRSPAPALDDLTPGTSAFWQRNLAVIELANVVQEWCEGTFRDGVPIPEVTAMFRKKIEGGRSPAEVPPTQLQKIVAALRTGANHTRDFMDAAEGVDEWDAEGINLAGKDAVRLEALADELESQAAVWRSAQQ